MEYVLRIYSTIPVVPTIGDCLRIIAIFQEQTAFLGLDGLLKNYPPQILLINQPFLKKFLLKIISQIGIPNID